MHQGERHLLFALHAQQRLQDCTQCSVVVGDVLRKLLVQLHREDVHCLVAGLDAQRGVDDLGAPDTAALIQDTGLDHRVPLLHKLPARDAGDGDADKAQICAFLLITKIHKILLSFHNEGDLKWYFSLFYGAKIQTMEDYRAFLPRAGALKEIQPQMSEPGSEEESQTEGEPGALILTFHWKGHQKLLPRSRVSSFIRIPQFFGGGRLHSLQHNGSGSFLISISISEIHI